MTSFQIGSTSVTRIEESAGLGFQAKVLLPDWHDGIIAEHKSWLVPGHFNVEKQRFVLSVHSWLIRTKHHNILVDTCGGDDKDRPDFLAFHQKKTGYLEKLAAAGLQPEDIDYVLCTHLHIDHVGWNTRLIDGRWVPTFPNAKYVFSPADLALYDPAAGIGGDKAERAQLYQDSILPIIASGQTEHVTGPHTLGDGLHIEGAPGHTPGHVILRLAEAGQEALFVGDIMHHPIQVYQPEWNSAFCIDPVAARQSRRRVLERCAEHGGLLCPAHFAAPHFGHITARGGAFTFGAANSTP
jgi:glyoxylase-like metal-dependent hydrolase (beta-lactamase superfamily II)